MPDTQSPNDVAPGGDDYPDYPSHFRPRTRAGWIAVVLFLGLFALTQPPFVHGLANRIEPWIFGVPFLYFYLLALYVALIGVLCWAHWKGL
jgi:hypothetical protein